MGRSPKLCGATLGAYPVEAIRPGGQLPLKQPEPRADIAREQQCPLPVPDTPTRTQYGKEQQRHRDDRGEFVSEHM